MRRENRKPNRNNVGIELKIIKYATIGVSILTLIVIGLLVYSRSLNEEVKQGTLSSEQLASIVNKTSENMANTESASTEIGKSVEEAKNEQKTGKNEVIDNKVNTSIDSSNVLNTIKENTNISKKDTTNTSKSIKAENTSNSKIEEKTESKELNFEKPVEGEIIKEFSKDNLIYSETLNEWTIHTGIDIKADKTTVVKSAEAGTVKSIKNDPRFGLTIVVEHDNGFQTIYSNLLTSEFVVEGEKVEKGQSLGTVGNTAAFESAEESHLHFEILKDSIAVDPSIYL